MERSLRSNKWNESNAPSALPGAPREMIGPCLTTDDAMRWCEERQAQYARTGEQTITADLAPRLDAYADKYVGNRIFVIGNGPSLLRTDLSLLESEFTFATNRFYLMYDRLSWTPSFYTATDWRAVPDNFLEINGLAGSTSFYDYRYHGLLNDKPGTVWFDHSGRNTEYRRAGFSPDARQGLVGAGSVVGTAIQLAFYMGFDPIYLIGCDLGYQVLPSVQQEGDDRFGTGTKIFLTGTANDDPNHFDPRYFGEGKRWHDPNVGRMIEGHAACRAAIEGQGRQIYNATVGGQLEVYERADYAQLLA